MATSLHSFDINCVSSSIEDNSIPFPLSIFHVYFRFLLIFVATFEKSIYQLVLKEEFMKLKFKYDIFFGFGNFQFGLASVL